MAASVYLFIPLLLYVLSRFLLFAFFIYLSIYLFLFMYVSILKVFQHAILESRGIRVDLDCDGKLAFNDMKNAGN